MAHKFKKKKKKISNRIATIQLQASQSLKEQDVKVACKIFMS